MLWLEGVSETVAERRRIVHHGGSGDEDMTAALLGRFTVAINREHDNGVGHGGLSSEEVLVDRNPWWVSVEKETIRLENSQLVELRNMLRDVSPQGNEDDSFCWDLAMVVHFQ
ncbi:hypothetical protein RIF29_32261 [Crotalaria pallida]|uniref:Uncharacterized protein n=1 Tax=Crotalaria pallida TaxID=3830 RepID=A0AAN9EIT6_CROPI